VIVGRCVQLISRSIASIPIKVEINEKEMEDHPVIALLQKPNPRQGRRSFMEQVASFHQITGNSYVEAIRAGSEPKELWPWAPYQMTVAAPARGLIPLGFTFDDGNPQHKRVWEVDRVSGQCDLLQLKTFHPEDPWYGLSPIANCALAADQHNEANTWNMRMLQNTAVPPGALMSKAPLTEQQFNRLKLEIEATYSGSKNARRPMVLSGDITWQALSLSPQEMDWLEGKNLSAREIAAGFGVPTQCIPIQGDQTFANYEQARLALWQDTVIPLAKSIYEDMGRWFSLMYGEDLCIELELDEVPALEPARKAKYDMVNNATFLTTNEKREAVGMEPIEDTPMADRILITGSQQPMPTADEQALIDQQQQAIVDGQGPLGPDGKPAPQDPNAKPDLKEQVKRQLKAIGL
jgi:HK97 family phage portal protein